MGMMFTNLNISATVLLLSAAVRGTQGAYNRSFDNMYGGLSDVEYYECMAVNWQEGARTCTELNYRGVPTPKPYIDDGRYRDSKTIFAGLTAQVFTGGTVSPMEWARSKFPNAPKHTKECYEALGDADAEQAYRNPALGLRGQRLGTMEFFNLSLADVGHPGADFVQDVGNSQRESTFTVQSTTDANTNSKAVDVSVNGQCVTRNQEYNGAINAAENILGPNLLGMAIGAPVARPRQAMSGRGSVPTGLGYKPYRGGKGYKSYRETCHSKAERLAV